MIGSTSLKVAQIVDEWIIKGNMPEDPNGKKTRKNNITIIIDDFKEDSDELFKKMLSLVRTLAPNFVSQSDKTDFNKVCIMRVGKTTENLTNGYINDVNQIKNSLHEKSEDEEFLNYLDGLRSLKNGMFNPDVKEVFFIVTTKIEEIPKLFFQKFDQDKKIVAILNYFGSESEQKLEDWKSGMACPSTYIKYEQDFTEIDIANSDKKIKSLNLPKPSLKLDKKGFDCLYLSVDIKGGKYELLEEVTIRYNRKGAPDKLIEFKTKTFEEIEISNLANAEYYSFNCKLKLKGGMESDWSDKIEFQTFPEHFLNPRLRSKDLESLVNKKLMELKELKLPDTISDSELLETEKLNILLLGKTGAGKSSFLNTMNGIFSGHFSQIAPTANFDFTFTNKLRKYEISNSINLWDIFGVENSNYDPEFLRKLLRGKLYNVEENKGVTSYKEIKGSESVLPNFMHGVIFIVDWKTLSDAKVTEKNREIVSIVRECNIPIQMMLTKIDTLSKELEGFNSRNLFSDPVVMARIEIAAQKYVNLVNKISIFPFKNQLSPTEPRDYATEYIALYSIEIIMNHAIRIILSNYKVIEVVDCLTMNVVDRIVVKDLAMSLDDVTELIKKSDKLYDSDFSLVSNFCDSTITENIVLLNILEQSEDITKADFRIFVSFGRGQSGKKRDIIPRQKIPELEIYLKKRGDQGVNRETEKYSIIEKVFFDDTLTKLQTIILDEFQDKPELQIFQFLSPTNTYIQNKNRVRIEDILFLSDEKKPSICIETGDIIVNFRIENKEDSDDAIEELPLNMNSKLRAVRVELATIRTEVDAFYLKIDGEYYPVSEKDEEDRSVVELSFYDHEKNRYVLYYGAPQ